MDHLSTRLLARYALGDITDEQELASLEDHLLECEACRRMAVAIDLVGTQPPDADDKPPLHIAAGSGDSPTALCGEAGPRNIISEGLLPGLDVAVVCPRCLALLRDRTGQFSERIQ